MNLGQRLKVALKMAGMNAPAVERASGVRAATVNALLRRDSGRSNHIDTILSVLPGEKVNVEWVRSGLGSPEPISSEIVTSNPGNKERNTPPRAAAHIAVASGGKRVDQTFDAAPLRAWEYEKELPPVGAWVLIPKLAVMHSPSDKGTDEQLITLLMASELQPFQAGWIRDDNLNPCTLGWGLCEDDSMATVLFKGDMFVVDTSDVTIEDGATFAVWYGGRVRVRKLFILPGGGVRVTPKNDSFESFDVQDPSDLHIVGRVVRKSGKGGL